MHVRTILHLAGSIGLLLPAAGQTCTQRVLGDGIDLPQDLFGAPVALDGDRFVTRGREDGGTLFVFERDPVARTWSQADRMTGSPTSIFSPA